MSSGKVHDNACIALFFGAITAGAIIQVQHVLLGGYVIIGGMGALSGLLLSPDLDLQRSNPRRRWGPLDFIWWPYAHVLAHRSMWSHAPILGTLLRLAYVGFFLLAVLFFGACFLSARGIDASWSLTPDQVDHWLTAALSWAIGLGVADAVHLALDLWSSSKRRRG